MSYYTWAKECLGKPHLVWHPCIKIDQIPTFPKSGLPFLYNEWLRNTCCMASLMHSCTQPKRHLALMRVTIMRPLAENGRTTIQYNARSSNIATVLDGNAGTWLAGTLGWKNINMYSTFTTLSYSTYVEWHRLKLQPSGEDIIISLFVVYEVSSSDI